MKLIGQIIALIVIALLVGAIGSGVYLAFEYLAALFMRLDQPVAIITGISWVIALAACWMIARAIRAASQQGKVAALREERTATYQLFLDYWENVLRHDGVQMDQLPAEFSEKLKVLERLLALYGGAAVLKAHTSLRSVALDKGALDPDARTRFGEALVAARKDLGSDTPRNIAAELERLLLPVADANKGVAGSRDAGSQTMAAPAS